MLELVWLCLPAQLFSPVPTGPLGIGPGKGVGPTYFWWLVSGCRTAGDRTSKVWEADGQCARVPFLFKTYLLLWDWLGPKAL